MCRVSSVWVGVIHTPPPLYTRPLLRTCFAVTFPQRPWLPCKTSGYYSIGCPGGVKVFALAKLPARTPSLDETRPFPMLRNIGMSGWVRGTLFPMDSQDIDGLQEEMSVLTLVDFASSTCLSKYIKVPMTPLENCHLAIVL